MYSKSDVLTDYGETRMTEHHSWWLLHILEVHCSNLCSDATYTGWSFFMVFISTSRQTLGQ